MARSISIDPLSLHYFSISEDHFVVRHGSTKCDKEGDKPHNKAVYCNPHDSVVCVGVSLGIWLCIEQRSFEDNSEKMFLCRGGKSGSAAHRYCDQLLTLAKGHWDIVQTHIQNMSVHGFRKESATHVASATTCPPPIASPTANRGDWSLHQVLDVYLAVCRIWGCIPGMLFVRARPTQQLLLCHATSLDYLISSR